MKCKTFQSQLLTHADPVAVPDDLREHLGECAVCQRWHEQLVALERNVRSLPTPAGRRSRAAVLQLFANPTTPAPISWYRRPALLAPLALAACLFLAVGLVWLVRPTARPATPAGPTDALLARVVARNGDIALAATPQARLEALADLADDLLGQVRQLALVDNTNGDDIEVLARLYERVVSQGIVRQMLEIDPIERKRAIEKIGARLTETGVAAEGLLAVVPPASARSIRAIAATAKAAHRQLHEQLLEAKT